MTKYLLPFLFILYTVGHLKAQSDIGDLLDEKNDINYAKASFKTNRVINLHSLENTAQGVMDVKISHRFGVVKNGFYDLFGIDAATQRIGMDYGVTDNFEIGINRNSVNKAYDGFLKYRILRQSKGKVNMPITLSVLTSAARITEHNSRLDNFTRMNYTSQIILGRKFNDKFTFEIVPSYVRRNGVFTVDEKFDVFACGFAGRLRLTRRMTLNGEYIYVLPNQLASGYTNSLSVGVDIETGGHVFQLHFTNSTSMSEYGFITQTTDKWKDGNVRFGFNVSRVFTLYDPKRK